MVAGGGALLTAVALLGGDVQSALGVGVTVIGANTSWLTIE
jgi:hypothetical protein